MILHACLPITMKWVCFCCCCCCCYNFIEIRRIFFRAPWSFKKCNILNQPLFQPCHMVVDPRPYFDACYHDTCGCDMGGDCECLCTAVAAYAQICSANGVHIKWRSQEFCRKPLILLLYIELSIFSERFDF